MRNEFYEAVIQFFSDTQKTSWGKNELVAKIKELYIEYLEIELNLANRGTSGK